MECFVSSVLLARGSLLCSVFFYGFNFYFRIFISSIMLFGEWSGQKSLKLKIDKICRPGPSRMTGPINDFEVDGVFALHQREWWSANARTAGNLTLFNWFDTTFSAFWICNTTFQQLKQIPPWLQTILEIITTWDLSTTLKILFLSMFFLFRIKFHGNMYTLSFRRIMKQGCKKNFLV